MNFVLCEAPKQLVFTLYLRNVKNEATIVVTDNKDLQRYCDEQMIYNISLDRFGEWIKIPYSIHPCDNVFVVGLLIKGYRLFYLVKECSKICNVYYKNLYDRKINRYKPSWYKPIFIRGGFIRLKLWLKYGIKFVYYEYNNNPVLGVDDKFFQKYNIKEYPLDISCRQLCLEAVKQSQINYGNLDNVIIDDCTPLEGITIFESVEMLFKKLFKTEIDFCFKRHPSPDVGNSHYQYYYNLFEYIHQLPRHIPVELFFSNISNCVISIQSSSLITATKFSHLKSISLLELVGWVNNSYKDEWREYFVEQSDGKILFPKSFNELKELIT